MCKIKFVQDDCISFMNKLASKGAKLDLVLTSPPYNTGRPSTSERSRNNHEGRYDIHMDAMTNQEYCDWCVNIFNHFDKILKPNGVILWNVSYSSDATVNTEGIDCLWTSIADILKKTNFMIADKITWKRNLPYQIMFHLINLQEFAKKYLYSVGKMNIKLSIVIKK